MTPKIISIVDVRNTSVSHHSSLGPVSLIESPLAVPTGHLRDALGRPLHDLRISVTDRCNFRCTYCMPKEIFDAHYVFLRKEALLSFDEITRIAKLFVAHGVQKIRLTGGEPLLRKNLEKLVAMLSALKRPDGLPLDMALTTNGSLLAAKAQSLKDAGLQRITVSLDALDDAVFRRVNNVDYSVADVLRGLDVAHRVGLGPIKVNMVVKAGVNDSQIEAMACHFKDSPFTLRFIEYMDVGSSNGWTKSDVIASADIVRRVAKIAPIECVPAAQAGETAQRWRYLDGSGEFGVISSVTQAFCGDCSRVRLSVEGMLYTCLFATSGNDLRTLLRSGADDTLVSTRLAQLWQARTDRYSAIRATTTDRLDSPTDKIEMSYIGG